MKKVYICSPLRGNYEENIRNAALFCRAAIKKGYTPIAPHIYFPQFLDDSDESERAAGIKCGLEALEGCEEIWVFLNPGEIPSEGMWGEIKRAAELEIPILGFRTFDSFQAALFGKWEKFTPFVRVLLGDEEVKEMRRGKFEF